MKVTEKEGRHVRRANIAEKNSIKTNYLRPFSKTLTIPNKNFLRSQENEIDPNIQKEKKKKFIGQFKIF